MTLAVKEAIRERVSEAKDVIAMSSDPELDKLLKGMIRAFNDVLEVSYGDISDTTVEDIENAV